MWGTHFAFSVIVTWKTSYTFATDVDHPPGAQVTRETPAAWNGNLDGR